MVVKSSVPDKVNLSAGPQCLAKEIQFMLVAGEASGDRLGADLVGALREKSPGAGFFGTPGAKMRAAGVESIFDSDGWSVVGIGPVVAAVPKFLQIKSKLSETADRRRPDAVILIDFPEFNLKLAKALKKRGHCVVYYVSPQLWAWRRYRARTIRESVDLLLSILPFEIDWYLRRGIKHVKFVGNPVAARTRSKIDRDEFRALHGVEPAEKLIALLPGSREKEIARHMPVMIKAAKIIRGSVPDAKFMVAAVDERLAKVVRTIIDGDQKSPITVVVTGESYELLNAADAAAISSGTATLEAGILNTPMVVVYKVPRLDHFLLRRIVDVPHFALINLVAGKRIVTELIQDEFNAETLANEISELLSSAVNERIRRELKAATENLADESPSERAAEAILGMLERSV